MKSIIAASIILGISPILATSVWAADWSDTSMNINYGADYREPANDQKIAKTVLEITHASGYKYGSNYFDFQFLKSDSQDPSAGQGNTDGAAEVYAVYRHQLSLSAISDRKLSFGPVKDISLTTGFDIGTKNTGFGSRPIKLIVGPTLNFFVDNGFLDFTVAIVHETNNNGIVGKSVHFDNTYQLSSAWSKAFSFGLPAVLKGYAVHTGKKGKDGFGVETAAETVLHALVMFDIGSLAGHKDALYAGVGVDHYTNKFGESKANQTTPIAQLEVHF